MRITALFLTSLFVTASAYASVERQQPYEEVSRALQQAKRVALIQNEEVIPRAFILGQRVAQNAKTIGFELPKTEAPQKKTSKRARAKL